MRCRVPAKARRNRTTPYPGYEASEFTQNGMTGGSAGNFQAGRQKIMRARVFQKGNRGRDAKGKNDANPAGFSHSGP